MVRTWWLQPLAHARCCMLTDCPLFCLAGPAAGAWFNQRVLDGALNRVTDEFHRSVWDILAATPAGTNITVP